MAIWSLSFKLSPLLCWGERRAGERGKEEGVHLSFPAIALGLSGLRVLWSMCSECWGQLACLKAFIFLIKLLLVADALHSLL